MAEETLLEFNKRWKHYVLRNKNLLPALYDDEVKKNNYNLTGYAYRRY